MASAAGTSDSSGGEGGRSTNKRSRMNHDNPSNPESFDSTQPGCVSSVMRVEPVHLKCVVCQDYPPTEVNQCKEGHLVCSKCIANVRRCPNCRVLYTKKVIRSRVAETDLDGMTFNCRFKNSGCLRTNLYRHQRTSHEIQCDFNPQPSGLKFCEPFDPKEVCQFRIEPNSIIVDPEHTKDIIEHLTCHPHNRLYEKIRIGKESSFLVPLPNSDSPYFKTSLLFEVFDRTCQTIGYYVLIKRVSIPARNNISYAVVGLNCSPVDLNGANRHSDKITVKLSIQAKTDPNKVAKDGDECVPDLSWTIKSTYLDEWNDFMMTPIEDRPPFSFSVPIKFLEEYYKHENGTFDLSVSFGPLDD